MIEFINKLCHERNLTFRGFCDKDGNQIEYKNAKTKLKLFCNICNYEWCTTDVDKFKRGRHCPNCSHHRKVTEEEALYNVKKTCMEKNMSFLFFCDKDGNKIKWNGTHNTYLKLHCNICGNENNRITYHNFISHNKGCKKCSILKNKKKKLLNTDFVIDKIQQMCLKQNCEFLNFCDKDGNQIEYMGIYTYLHLKCKKCNNIWNTTYSSFIKEHGCPFCKKYKLEEEIRNLLITNDINKFEERKFYKWLNGLQLDFYLPEYNIAIECQGIQHFKPIKFFGGDESFQLLLERDERKRKLCEKNGIKLLYYSNLHFEYPYKVYENKDELIKDINSMKSP